MKNPRVKTDAGQSVMSGTRRGFLALLPGMALAPLACLKAKADHERSATNIRWDLIHLIGNVISEGGSDSASAADGSQITLTGSGTFVVSSGEGGQGEDQQGDGEHEGVTGGGAWQTFDSTGASMDSGTYVVTGLVSFENAGPNGVAPPTLIDTIGNYLDARGGLAVLRVLYSDGERGVLTVSCHGPVNVPNTVFEGIVTTKGIVGYVDRGKPVSGVDGNRTIFHVLSQGDHEDEH